MSDANSVYSEFGSANVLKGNLGQTVEQRLLGSPSVVIDAGFESAAHAETIGITLGASVALSNGSILSSGQYVVAKLEFGSGGYTAESLDILVGMGVVFTVNCSWIRIKVRVVTEGNLLPDLSVMVGGYVSRNPVAKVYPPILAYMPHTYTGVAGWPGSVMHMQLPPFCTQLTACSGPPTAGFTADYPADAMEQEIGIVVYDANGNVVSASKLVGGSGRVGDWLHVPPSALIAEFSVLGTKAVRISPMIGVQLS